MTALRQAAVAAEDRGTSQAIVVFSGVAELPALRLLRPGFRHCFTVLERDGAWVVVDPLAHRTVIDMVPGSLACSAAEVEAFYRRRGLTALTVAVKEPPRRCAPLRPHSCVEVVKRIIGRRAPWVFTPWQLYCHLEKERQKCVNEEFMLDGRRCSPYK